MTTNLILGIAGPVGHGKTALVQALTGSPGDRLPEEKQRAGTIDLNFAHLSLDGYDLGVIDLPGDRRYARNMLAGATSLDTVVLVIDANQQDAIWHCEHLDLLHLLGLRSGVIALNKCDLAPEAGAIESEVRQLVRGTFLADAPMVRVSAHSGQGMSEIRAALRGVCCQVRAPAEGEWFRLPVDRAFAVRPGGVVVTGSVLSGVARVEDELVLQPGGKKVKVRGIQNHNRKVEEARPGQRAALRLDGVTAGEVCRGQELATPGFLVPARVLTVHLRVLAGAANRQRHNSRVHCHLGTAATTGRFSLLDCDELPPAGEGLAQLFLEEEVVAVWGQRLVLRHLLTGDPVGGARILQPAGSKVRRRHVKVIDHIESLAEEDDVVRALTVCWLRKTEGVTQADLVRGAGLPPDRAAQFLGHFRSRGDLLVVGRTPDDKEILAHAEIARSMSSRQGQSPLLSPPDVTGVAAE